MTWTEIVRLIVAFLSGALAVRAGITCFPWTRREARTDEDR
jgi:hypothetical protein